jgi:hypothetical protein
MISDLLKMAKTLPKGDYVAYSKCKRILDGLAVSQEEYMVAHCELIAIFEI